MKERIADTIREINPEEPYVILTVGMPGSGKTTLLKEAVDELGIHRLSPDDKREELSPGVYDRSLNKRVWRETENEARELLSRGESLAVDATHAEAWRRPRQIKMYREFGARAVIAVLVEVPAEVALDRNEARERTVNPDDLMRMGEALENEPPTTEEGFDEVITIKNS